MCERSLSLLTAYRSFLLATCIANNSQMCNCCCFDANFAKHIKIAFTRHARRSRSLQLTTKRPPSVQFVYVPCIHWLHRRTYAHIVIHILIISHGQSTQIQKMFESDGDENEQNQPIVNGVRTMRDLLENELNEKENMGAREKSHTTHEGLRDWFIKIQDNQNNESFACGRFGCGIRRSHIRVVYVRLGKQQLAIHSLYYPFYRMHCVSRREYMRAWLMHSQFHWKMSKWETQPCMWSVETISDHAERILRNRALQIFCLFHFI